MTFASTRDAEKARSMLHHGLIGGRIIEVNDATAKVQNKKPNNNGNLNTNKNLASLVAAGLNPSSLPALMNLNRLASLNMLGNLVAATQPLVKPNALNSSLQANLNANLASQSVLNNDAYANTIAQLSGLSSANSLPAGLNNPLFNLVAAVTGNEQLAASNYITSQQQHHHHQTNHSPIVQSPTSAAKFNATSNLLLNPATLAGNANANQVQLSPNSIQQSAGNVCSANNYLNLINSQLLAQLAQPNLHYTATNGLNNSVANSQNNHAITTSSNLTLNLPSGKCLRSILNSFRSPFVLIFLLFELLCVCSFEFV